MTMQEPTFPLPISLPIVIDDCAEIGEFFNFIVQLKRRRENFSFIQAMQVTTASVGNINKKAMNIILSLVMVENVLRI